MEEKKLRENIPILKEIADSVSSEVRAQYEESPYPRWVNLRLNLKPMSVSDVVDQIKLKLYSDKIIEVRNPEILIAGCGTGQHSIESATRFKDSNVLAIDLSLSSLAYAKRKTKEYAIKNIEYMQADILNLGNIEKQFDIIESNGVLHHMNDPMIGWKTLTESLTPGGLMRIGLYSDLARQNITKVRAEIKRLGIGSSIAEMRSFRDVIKTSEKANHKEIKVFSDFYSLSEFRDLLFHVQEHTFTIPKIIEHLENLKLKFCGFEAPRLIARFKLVNKKKNDLYDLEKWQAYEEANPESFAGMYQFWCQKVD